MERILLFLPSILIIGGIAIVTFLYLKLMIRKFGDNLKSIDWVEQNKLRVSLLLSSPNAYILAPTWEELVFRAPIIIMFSELSQSAWYGILVSSILFSVLHWRGNKITLFEILDAKELGENKSDNLKDESERLRQEKKKRVKLRKALHVLLTFPTGIMLAYCGIKYQSIWMTVGLHSLWNLFMPFVVVFIILSVFLIYTLFSSLWERAKTVAGK